MEDGKVDEKRLNNGIDRRLKQCLDVAVSRTEYSQKVVISAALESVLDIDDRAEGIASIDEDKLQDELEQYVERYE